MHQPAQNVAACEGKKNIISRTKFPLLLFLPTTTLYPTSTQNPKRESVQRYGPRPDSLSLHLLKLNQKTIQKKFKNLPKNHPCPYSCLCADTTTTLKSTRIVFGLAIHRYSIFFYASTPFCRLLTPGAELLQSFFLSQA